MADRKARTSQYAPADLSSPCILYEGRVGNSNGYGHKWCRTLQKVLNGPRAVWIDTYGPIADNIDVCHGCDTLYPAGDITYRRCWNIDHLYVAPRWLNLLHMSAVGRAYTSDAPRNVGSLNGRAVIDETAVLEMRQLYAQGIPQSKIAEAFGVSGATVSRAVSPQSRFWKHLRVTP